MGTRSVGYIVTVTLVAAAGFAGQTLWLVVVAALLAVPASIVALPCYYLTYGLLALVPGANPSSSSGSRTAAPGGRVLSTVGSGEPAAWFTVAAVVLGVLSLALAASVNVRLARSVSARRRSGGAAPTAPVPRGR